MLVGRKIATELVRTDGHRQLCERLERPLFTSDELNGQESYTGSLRFEFVALFNK